MSIFDDAALSFLSSRGMVVEGYKRRCTRPDGTVHELYIDRLMLDGSPGGLKALSSLLSETENNRYLTAGKTEQVISASTDTNSPPLLTEYLELFLQWKEGGNKDITEQTVQEYQRVVNLFIEMFGDLPVSQYTEKNAVNFRETMRSLPPYARSRLPFQVDELGVIFAHGNIQVNPIWPSHYWVPLLALYTGMRRSEIFLEARVTYFAKAILILSTCIERAIKIRKMKLQYDKFLFIAI